MDVSVSHKQPPPNIHDAIEYAGNATRAFLQCREKSRKHVVLRRRLIGRQYRGRDGTATAKLNRRVKRRVKLIGAGNITRNCKGDYAVAARWGDTRTLTGKFFDGGIERIARTVGFVLGLTLELDRKSVV